MAQNNKDVVSASSSENRPSSAEVRQFYEENKDRIAKYASAETAIKQLTDLTKNTFKSVATFNKENLRTYFTNIGSNEKNLRNLSRFLWYRCHPYFKLIQYFANMFMLQAHSVIPEYSIVEENNKDEFLKSYDDTLNIIQKMNLQYEFYKIYVTCFREDVFYGVSYLDDDGFFILPLDPDYCRIAGFFPDGSFAYAMNFEYFRGTNEYLLDYYGEPFVSLYRAYGGRTVDKWQVIPEEYSVCLKYRAEDWQTIVPVFSGIFNGILNLLNTEDIEAIADEQQIYKLIWLKMPLLSGTKKPDDWAVDPSLLIKYFNRMVEEALPDYASAAIVPGDLDTISFDRDVTNDITSVAKSTETLFNTSGGAQILNSATLSGSTAFNAAMIADSEFAISSLLPQTQAIVNRIIKGQIKNAAFVKFMPVTVFTKATYKKELQEDATYGLPVKIMLNTLNNFSEKETLALTFLENDCLNLADKFIPLRSSHTSSATNDVGRPTEDDDTITEDGEASRDKTDNAN